jgi:hypothetical protein
MELDWTGDGGGWSAAMGESTGDSGSSGVCMRGGRSLRLALETLERPLLPDRTEAASAVLSVDEVSTLASTAEFLGLSVLALLPGILDRRDRKDRDDSLVSDLLKDGYDCRGGSPAPEPDPFGGELPSLECWLPMMAQSWVVAGSGEGATACLKRRAGDAVLSLLFAGRPFLSHETAPEP